MWGDRSVLTLQHSIVGFLASMEEAQWPLPITVITAQDVQNALGRTDLMQAIGGDMGNTAAHEIGHQFFLSGSGMDDASTPTTAKVVTVETRPGRTASARSIGRASRQTPGETHLETAGTDD